MPQLATSALVAAAAALALTVGAASAGAQPGLQRPGPPPESAFPLDLSPEEAELLARGEISPVKHVAGVGLALYPGFGLGHAVQGRWGQRGWFFTVGQVGSTMVLLTGILSCGPDGKLLSGRCPGADVGVAMVLGFKVWEVADAWIHPARHNRRVRALRETRGGTRWSGFVAPTGTSSAVGGLTLRF
jgi:hypothetical protein